MRRLVALSCTCVFVTAGCGGLTRGTDDGGSEPLALVSVEPASGATGVDLGTTLAATFGEPLDAAATITVKLSPEVAGATTLDGATVRWAPTARFAGETTYTVTIEGAASQAGHEPAAPVTWTFTTRALDTVAPGAVANLATTTVTTTSIGLSWTAPGDDDATGTAARYELRWKTGTACSGWTDATFASGTLVEGVPAPLPAGSAQELAVENLATDTPFCLRLAAFDEDANASISNVVTAATKDEVPPATPVLRDTFVQGDSVGLEWLATGDNGDDGTAAAYDLRYVPGGDCSRLATPEGFETAARVETSAPGAPGTTEHAVITGLASDAWVCIVLRVTDEAGNSARSEDLSLQTPDVTAPAAVTPTVGTVTGFTIELSWIAPGDDGEAGQASIYDLRILRGACPANPDDLLNLSGLSPTLPAPAEAGASETYTVRELTPLTDYCLAFRTSDEVSNAAPFGTLEVRTHREDETAPAPPTDFAVSYERSENRLRISWVEPADDGSNPASGKAHHYELRSVTGRDCRMDEAAWETATAAPESPFLGQEPGAEAFTFLNQPPHTTVFCFGLRAFDEADNASDLAIAARIETPDGTWPATPVITLVAATLTNSSAEVEWIEVGDDEHDGILARNLLRYRKGNDCLRPAFDTEPFLVAAGPAPVPPGLPTKARLDGLAHGAHYCLAVVSEDEAGHGALSEPIEFTTIDDVPPDAPRLTAGTLAARSAEVLLDAPGDNGNEGVATAYDVRYVRAASCAGFDAAAFQAATGVADVPAPREAGTRQSLVVKSLSPSTTYCLAVTARDEANNTSVLSNVLTITTADDTRAPADLVLSAAPSLTAPEVTLTWTAPANDGADVTSGPATTYEIRRIAPATGGCEALTQNSFASATVLTAPTPAAPRTAETLVVKGLSDQRLHCFAARALDAATPPNAGNVSPWVGATLGDFTRPGAITDLAAVATSASSVRFTFTAPGDDATTGTAVAYRARWRLAACPAVASDFNFDAAPEVALARVPLAAGSADGASLASLQGDATYCFALVAADESGNVGLPSNLVEVKTLPSAATQIGAVRALIKAGSTTTTTFSAPVRITDAVVTYVKAAVGGATGTSADAAGFFVQNDATGPALYFAIDPASIATDLAPGDVVDLTATQGGWRSCSACTADNSLYAVTAATGIRTSPPRANLPNSQNLSNEAAFATDIPAAGALGWEYDTELVTIGGTLKGAFVSAGTGFQRILLQSTGSGASGRLALRTLDGVVASLGLADGCTVQVGPTPLWRFLGEAQASAWRASELVVTGCPTFNLVSTVPATGSTGASVRTRPSLTFSAPVKTSTFTAQATSGECTGNVQLSADHFQTCLALTVEFSANNTVAQLVPVVALANSALHELKISTAVEGASGRALESPATISFTTSALPACSPGAVVISQVFGGGGGAYTNDFIELHNRSSTDVSVAGWSVQYASATGSNWSRTDLTGIIVAGGYYLVQEGSGTAGTSTLPMPTAQATGAISMSATAGKVALMATATTLAAGTVCPTATAVDFVGYGGTAGTTGACYEGSAPTPAPSTSNAVLRGAAGCTDSNNNGSDFAAGAPTPRNASSGLLACGCD